MACLSAPHVSLGDLGLDLFIPKITVPDIRLPGITLCCTLQLPPIPMYLINAAIAAIISLIPGLGKVLQPVLAILMKAIAAINAVLDLITFKCPLD
jgi:hypothetical protein